MRFRGINGPFNTMRIFIRICFRCDECTLVQTGYVAFARETIVSLARVSETEL